MLKNSLTILTVYGIPIKLHISFLLILPFFAYVIGTNIAEIALMAGLQPELISFNPYLLGLILAILLFASVVLHELSHSYIAVKQGLKIKDITLMLLGGVAQIEDESGIPRDEVLMAFAGPFLSLVLGIILLGIIRPATVNLAVDYRLIIYYLGFMNIFLAVFNLIPAFPSDGGRILRSLLARRISYLKATKIATNVGKMFAFLLGFIGLVNGQIFLILIAFFIYIGASQEQKFNLVRDIYSDLFVEDLMTKDVVTVNENINVAELLDKMLKEKHTGYPVMNNSGELTGCITLSDIKEFSEKLEEMEIKELMSRDLVVIKPSDPLFDAHNKMAINDIGRLMVVEGGELLGILTRSDVMKAQKLKSLKEQKIRSMGDNQ